MYLSPWRPRPLDTRTPWLRHRTPPHKATRLHREIRREIRARTIRAHKIRAHKIRQRQTQPVERGRWTPLTARERCSMHGGLCCSLAFLPLPHADHGTEPHCGSRAHCLPHRRGDPLLGSFLVGCGPVEPGSIFPSDANLRARTAASQNPRQPEPRRR